MGIDSKQLAAAVQIFDSMKNQSLLPMHEMASDPVRKELDRRFAIDVLGLDQAIVTDDGPLNLLRQKLGAEPSVRGNKTAPPK